MRGVLRGMPSNPPREAQCNGFESRVRHLARMGSVMQHA